MSRSALGNREANDNRSPRPLIGCHHPGSQDGVFREMGFGLNGFYRIARERGGASPSSAFFDIGTAWRRWNARNLHIGRLYQWASLE